MDEGCDNLSRDVVDTRSALAPSDGCLYMSAQAVVWTAVSIFRFWRETEYFLDFFLKQCQTEKWYFNVIYYFFYCV